MLHNKDEFLSMSYYNIIECFRVLKASYALAHIILILFDEKVEA